MQYEVEYDDNFIDYTADELNSLMSIILTALTEDKEITDKEADVAKTVFNTLINLVVNEQESADAMLRELYDFEEKYERERYEKELSEFKKEVVVNANEIVKMYAQRGQINT